MISYHTKRAQRYNSTPQQQRYSTIYVNSQMTDSRQHAESPMLQPCRTAAAVGDTIYVRLAYPRYLCCGELLVSEPVINICHPTIPHVSVMLPLWVRVSIGAET